MQNRWGKEFVKRDLEEVERRAVEVGSYRLPEEEVARRILSRDERAGVWMTRAVIAGIAYIDWAAVFLCGFLLGYVVSALR